MTWLLNIVGFLAKLPSLVNQLGKMMSAVSDYLQRREATKRRKDKDEEVDRRIDAIINGDSDDKL